MGIENTKAKEGRIRGNLLGKRVNFSARTVISPDPRLSINEVGVPESIAQELTIPEYVTALNIKQIKEMIKAGKINYLARPDGRRIKVSEENRKDLIENVALDWSVDRQLQDGDIVLFNRQPSLHRVSMMAHRVKVMPYRTFRMNPSVCPPYNADFDGDEMNLHALQTEEARTEADMLMDVKYNIKSPRSGGPVIGLDLDQISGVFLLSKKTTMLSREEASQLLGDAGIEMDLPEQEQFTGKELLSMLLPKGLNMEYKASCCENCDECTRSACEHDAWVVIKNGEIKSGCIDSRGVGAFKGRIISKIDTLYEDKEEVKNFLDRCGRMGIAFLMRRGFTLGISDLDVDPSVRSKIDLEIRKAEKDSDSLIEKFRRNELKILPGMTAEASLEAQIMNTLASGVSSVADIISENIKKSDILVMVKSGAKGSMINTTQMAAVVGQETILGKRIKRGYMGRTLPHIRAGDLSPMSHGFVSRGFKDGLTPFELFWNIMNGREGLMDKSLRTRKSGYMQRRLINALQDLKVCHDLSVRNANNQLIEFIAGEDGIDPSKSDAGKLNWKEFIV